MLEVATAALEALRMEQGWRDAVEDPAAFARCRFWATAAALAPLAARRLAAIRKEALPATVEAVRLALEQRLGEYSLLARALESDPSAEAWEALLAIPPSVDLAEVHELVLGHAHMLRDGAVTWDGCDVGLHQLGSYYTPAAVADVAVAQIAASLAVPLVGARVVDFSCGGGRFLSAWVRHVLASAPGACPLEAFGGLGGFDVDPIALELARVELAFAAGEPALARALTPRFRLGNPLLIGSEPQDPEAAVQAAASGYMWDPALAVQDLGEPWDVVIGNPPWEKIRLEERAFFKHIAPAVAACTRKDARTEAIARATDGRPALAAHYHHARATIEEARNRIAADPRLAPAAAHELNSYALFTALGVGSLAPDGVMGLLVKSALVTAPANQRLFNALVASGRLRRVWDFVNSERIFAIDSRERFAFLLCGPEREATGFRFAMGLVRPEEMSDPARLREVDAPALRVINPLTGMLPSVSEDRALTRLETLARTNAAFADVYPEARFGRIVHLTTHAEHIRRSPGPGLLPILEGKFIEQYDGRFAGFEGIPEENRSMPKARARLIPEEAKADPAVAPESRFFIAEDVWARLTKNYPGAWSLVWRNTTSATNRRTCLATILPHGPAIQSIQFVQLADERRLALLLATMNSVPFDAMLRARLNGIDLTQKVVRQVPVPPAARWDEPVSFGGRRRPLGEHVLGRVRALLADDARLAPFVGQLPAGHPTSRERRRATMRELDRLLGYAYGIEPALLQEMAAELANDLTPEEREALGDPREYPRP